MRGFKHAVAVADIGAGRHAQPAHLGRRRVGNVVAIQIGRGQHLILVGTRENLLEDGVRDAVVDHDFLLPLAFAVGRADGIKHPLHLGIDLFAKCLRASLHAGLDHGGVLLHA